MIATASAYDKQLRAQIVLNHPRLFTQAQTEAARALLSGRALPSAPVPSAPAAADAAAAANAVMLERDLMGLCVSHLRACARHARALAIWGTGSGGRRVQALLARLGIPLLGFFDRDHAKVGTLIDGHPVLPLERLSAQDPPCVVVASAFAKDIRRVLEDLGREEGTGFLIIPLPLLAALPDPERA
jgi:FlaA1/EpsC-like NDP-sugar epimerase